jgi:hypothetical protein
MWETVRFARLACATGMKTRSWLMPGCVSTISEFVVNSEVIGNQGKGE